ncbi:MAG: ankyrin repeat domain-containing protein [Longimicrobiales bacterium]
MNRAGVAPLAGLAAAAVLLVLVWLGLSYLYAATENRNFARLREKSALDCETMPLHCAVRDRDFEAVEAYRASGGDPELKDNWGQSALYWAVRQGRDDMAKALIAGGASAKTRNGEGRSLLYHTVASGNLEVADALIAAGANPDVTDGAEKPRTILHECVMKNQRECVEFLLARGADRTVEDGYGYTPLERAELHPHVDSAIADLLRS